MSGDTGSELSAAHVLKYSFLIRQTALLLLSCLVGCVSASSKQPHSASGPISHGTPTKAGDFLRETALYPPSKQPPLSILQVAIMHRELFLYDACGFAEEGVGERMALREFILKCSMPNAVKSEAISFMDSPSNQHYGNQDNSICRDDPALARVIRTVFAMKRDVRLALLAEAAQCGSLAATGLDRGNRNISSGHLDYWLSLNIIAMSGVARAERVK
jgi:hypothetical protein